MRCISPPCQDGCDGAECRSLEYGVPGCSGHGTTPAPTPGPTCDQPSLTNEACVLYCYEWFKDEGGANEPISRSHCSCCRCRLCASLLFRQLVVVTGGFSPSPRACSHAGLRRHQQRRVLLLARLHTRRPEERPVQVAANTAPTPFPRIGDRKRSSRVSDGLWGAAGRASALLQATQSATRTTPAAPSRARETRRRCAAESGST